MATLYGGNAGGSLSAQFSGSVAGDVLVLEDGQVNYTTGLDLSGTEYDTFRVAASYTGSLGAPGSSVQLDLSATTYNGIFEYASPGTSAYIAAASEIENARIYRTGSDGVYLTDGAFVSTEISDGRVFANDQADLQQLRMSGGIATIEDMTSQAVDTMILNGTASCVCARDIGTGTVGVNASLIVNERTVTPTTLNVYGNLTYWGGNIGTLNAFPGSTIDFSGLSNSITISTSEVWNNVTFIRPKQGVSITFSSNTMRNGGSSLPT